MTQMSVRAESQDEAGFSLVEILITTVIVGVAFSAILGGLITSISVSALHRKMATADALARSAAEWVKDDSRNQYDSSNANTASYSLGGVSVPSGFVVAITNVWCWDGSGPTAGAGYDLSSTSHFSRSMCSSTDAGLQLISITAASTDGKASQTVQILKRVMQ